MTKNRIRICEPCADQYLPFQVYRPSRTRHAICDTCNCWCLTESVQPKADSHVFGAPFFRDYDKILNELEVAYVEAASNQDFDLAEEIVIMIDKFETEKSESNRNPHD